MPIYEYKCLSCGTHVERLQKTSDDSVKVCESCGGELQKQWSLSGFQFKGEGWYVTDYAKKKDTTAAEKKSTSESTESSESASKQEIKSPVKEKKETKKKD